MKQPQVHLKDQNYDWGLRKVIQINWNSDGFIDMIEVEFGGRMFMRYDYDLKCYVNIPGNLKAELIFN